MHCAIFRAKAKRGQLEHMVRFIKDKGIALLMAQPGARGVYFVTRPDGEYKVIYFMDTLEHIKSYLEGPIRKKMIAESVAPYIEGSPNVMVYEVQGASVPAPI